MAITRGHSGTSPNSTGKGTNSGSASVSVSFVTSPVAGSFVGVMVEGFGANINYPSNGCTDNQGNTYTRAIFLDDNPRSIACAIYFCPSIGSPTGTFTITVTANVTAFQVIGAAEFSAASTSTTPAATQTNTDAGSTTAVSTGTTGALASAERLALAVFSGDSEPGTITIAGTGAWTQEFEELTFSFEPGEGDSQIATATTYEAHWTTGSGTEYVAAIAVFDAAAGGGVSIAPGAGSVPFSSSPGRLDIRASNQILIGPA